MEPLGGAVSPPKLLRQVSDARANEVTLIHAHPARALTKAAWVRAGKPVLTKLCISSGTWLGNGGSRLVGARKTQGKEQAVVLQSQEAASFLKHSRAEKFQVSLA